MSHQKSSILIVDDDPQIRQVFRLMLSKEPFDIFEAVDGLDALHQVSACNPALIILDVMMPKMNGFKVLEHLRKESSPKTLPILMLTAQISPQNKEKGLKGGVNKFLTKPISRNKLLSSINELLAI